MYAAGCQVSEGAHRRVGSSVHPFDCCIRTRAAQAGLQREREHRKKLSDAVEHYQALMNAVIKEHGHPSTWGDQVGSL